MAWSRSLLLSSLLGTTLLGGVIAQQSSVFETAVPPARTDLERLNLKSEWQTHLPLDGRKDGVGPIQVIDDQQIFVQLQSGLLVALDANTGARQWAYRYPTAYSTLHPVAVNEKYVFAINVNKLICLQRFTGLVEFDWEVRPRGIIAGQADGVLPFNGPLVDHTYVYVTTDGHEVMSYLLPLSVQIGLKGRAPGSAAENVATRYVLGSGLAPIKDSAFDQSRLPPEVTRPGEGLTSTQKTPSLSILPVVSPPYTLYGRQLQQTPSVGMLPTLRQPYELKPSYMRYNQQTPSISVIPPSVARVHELANLRPPQPKPEPYWRSPYQAPRRLQFQSVMVDPQSVTSIPRIWMTGEGSRITAISRANGIEQVRGQLQDEIVSPLSNPGVYGKDSLFGYVAVADGNVIALDLLGGTTDGPRIEWRAPVGGRMNHKPLATKDAVYVSGDRSGTAKIDVASGEMIWKSDSTADTVLAVNDEFVYVQDAYGDLLVFDKKNATDPISKRSSPLTKLDLKGFTRPVLNEQTDRIVLTSDSGLMICLRDASAKYTKPVRIAAPTAFPPPPKPAAPPPAPPAGS